MDCDDIVIGRADSSHVGTASMDNFKSLSLVDSTVDMKQSVNIASPRPTDQTCCRTQDAPLLISINKQSDKIRAAFSQKRTLQLTKIIARPSVFGLAICYRPKRLSGQRPKTCVSRLFNYERQMTVGMALCSSGAQVRVAQLAVPHSARSRQDIKEFDFSTPSPDDVVIEKQKKVFKR